MRHIEATSNGASESMPDPSDHMFLGPISATPLTSSVHAISCKEKALVEVSLPLSPKGKDTRLMKHRLWCRNQHHTHIPVQSAWP